MEPTGYKLVLSVILFFPGITKNDSILKIDSATNVTFVWQHADQSDKSLSINLLVILHCSISLYVVALFLERL